MPRPERPLDPEGDALQRFALELRRLREKSGSPGYRELARRAHYSPTTLSDAAGGRKLPGLAVTLAYVRACGGDVTEWEARWRAVATELADGELAEPDQPGQAPYLGLGTFQAEDADRFFGRSRWVAELLTQLGARRFLAVFGPSGCGKSSLLRAGLIPALTTGDRRVLVFTPGEAPLEECATRLARLVGIPAGALLADLRADPHHLHLAVRQALTDQPAEAELILVVDQFEEVFTLCPDEPQRAQFIAALLAAAESSTSRARVVLGVRADFYGRCAEHPDLIEALRDAQVLVGGMSADELREAIVRPAAGAGLSVESALVSTIVADMTGQPGALPLMSHALLETWRRRRGNALPLAGYEAAGGIAGALSRSAERAYQSLDQEQRDLAREMFLRLTAFGDGSEDTRRRVRRTELLTLAAGPGTGEAVLGTLVRARLLTADEETVEITHETLMRTWPRLRDWLAVDREGLRLHRQLTEATHVWDSLGRDPGALYRGLRLAQVEEWYDDRQTGLTPDEREFLDTSIAAQKQGIRSARRLRLTLSCLGLVLVLAAVAGGIAVQRGQDAAQQQRTALSRALAARSTTLAGTQPEAAMLLAVRAYGEAPTVEARSALLSAQASPFQARLHRSPLDTWLSVRYSPDGTLVAAGATTGAVTVWDSRSHALVASLPAAGAPVRALAFSPDGRFLATGSGIGELRLWDIGAHRQVLLPTGGRAISGLAFSPDGATLAVAGDGVTVWNVAERREIAVLDDDAAGVWGVAFSPDGRTLATGDYSGSVTEWDTTSRQRRLSWAGQPVTRQLAFSPDGATLAVASYDGTVQLRDPATGRQTAALSGHGVVMSLAFSPDSLTLITTGDQVTVWDVGTRAARAEWTGHRATITGVAYSPDGRHVVTAAEDATLALWATVGARASTESAQAVRLLGETGSTALTATRDGTVRTWDTTTGTPTATWAGDFGVVQTISSSASGSTLAAENLTGDIELWTPVRGWQTPTWTREAQDVAAMGLSPDGQVLATAARELGNDVDTITTWDLARGQKITEWPVKDTRTTSITFSPDGATLVTTTQDGAATLWDVAAGRPRDVLGTKGYGITATAFSPDGRFLALAAGDGALTLIDARTGDRITTIPSQGTGLDSIAFSPDGATLATGGRDGAVRLWDLAASSLTATLTGHATAVTTMTFGSGGQTLATAGEDGTTRLWDLDTSTVVTNLCHTIGDNVSTEQWSELAPELAEQPHCP